MKKKLIVLMVLVLGIIVVGCSEKSEETTLQVEDEVINYNPGIDAKVNEEVDEEVTNLINTKLEGEKCNFGVITGEVGTGEVEANNVAYDGVVTYMMIYNKDKDYNGNLEMISKLYNLVKDISDIYKKYDLYYEVYIKVYEKDSKNDYYIQIENLHSF